MPLKKGLSFIQYLTVSFGWHNARKVSDQLIVMQKLIITIIILVSFAKILPAQTCTNPGQTPVSATLICSTDPVIQSTIPVCGQTNIPVPCNDGSYIKIQIPTSTDLHAIQEEY
jgi:hypothetical protein